LFLTISERVNRVLPALYVIWALPLTLTMVWLIPPWNNPDETNHMLRVTELAHGELLGERFLGHADPLVPSGHQSGGLANAAIITATAPFVPLVFHPERKLTLSMRLAGDQVGWDASSSVVAFPNTASYPPLLYLPAILVVRISQAIGVHVDRTLFLAKAVTAATAVLISMLALKLARRTRYALAVMAMLPMTCELYASVSHDALMIAMTLLVVGWIDGIVETSRSAGNSEVAGIALALAAVTMARPPYVSLAVLAFLATERMRRSNVIATCFIVIAVILWSLLVSYYVLVPLVHSDPLTQANLLFAHPFRMVAVIIATLRLYGASYGTQFIGQLGYSDTSLPLYYIWFAAGVLGLGFVAATNGRSRRPWVALFAAVAGAVMVLASEYFIWTPPDAVVAEGAQGRHFIPLAAALILAVPGYPRLGRLTQPVALAGLGVLAITTPYVVVQALVLRYYLGG
jgi:uncharacterized membrane protein